MQVLVEFAFLSENIQATNKQAVFMLHNQDHGKAFRATCQTPELSKPPPLHLNRGATKKKKKDSIKDFKTRRETKCIAHVLVS